MYRYIAVKSAYDVNKPDKIYFYYFYEPYGYWWDKTCPKYVESCCQHGVGSTKICPKCNKMNIEIVRKMDRKENKSIKTISGLAK
jgi:hypothetical protein